MPQMTICERMFNELEKKNLTAYGLCKAIGVGTSTTTTWKKRNTDPPAEHIAKICEYLDCSVEYLLTGQETKKEPALGMSENGQEMLSLYERLSEREQVLLIGEARGLLLARGAAEADPPVPASSSEKAG